MSVLGTILINVIFPLFLLIAIGAVLHRRFSFDMNTLSKLNNYLLLPAVSFSNVYESKLGGEVLLHIIYFLSLQATALIIIVTIAAKLFKFEPELSSSFKNSVVLNNSGNFGLPVSQLVFQHNPLGASIQVVVMIFQNLLTYTYGLANSISVHSKGAQAFKQFFKNPELYAFFLGLLLHVLSIKIPQFLWQPIDNTANAFLAIALITLGAQSAHLNLKKITFPLVASLVGRLVLSPAIALLIIFCLKLDGITAQALFIASSFPTSRNSALFALEYDNRPEYAAQAVLLSTILSSLTVTIVVYTSTILF